MKKNEIEIEKYFIDYLVKTIKDKNLSSLEVTRTLSDKHKLKIKINNSVSSPTNQEVQTIKLENSSFKKLTQIVCTFSRSPFCGIIFLGH